MKIFITGIRGFIGSNLKNYLQSKGHEVIGSVSKNDNLKAGEYCLSLNQSFDTKIFNSVDLILHCAYIIKKNNFENNINGTNEIVKLSEINNVNKHIFFSSYSAHPKATSEYGKSKFILENTFREKYIIVRPGLVIGNGGVFKNIYDKINKFPILPLIGSGDNLIPFISIQDLCFAIEKIIQLPSPDQYNLFYNKKISLSNLIKLVSKKLNKNILLFPIPLNVIYFLLKVFETIKIPFSITTENLKGFQQNLDDIHISNLDSLLPINKSIEEVIGSSLKN